MSGFYNIGIFFSKRSTFLLFSVESDFRTGTVGAKVNMFKNLEGSKFCETFIELHNYRKSTLDIQNQFQAIKAEFHQDISFVSNETITLAKVEVDDRVIFDSLNIYVLTMNAYVNEFIFLITERHNVVKKLRKKIVRTSGLQIATTPALNLLNDFHEEFRQSKNPSLFTPIDRSHQIIKLSDEEN
jgi:hypothetical protein